MSVVASAYWQDLLGAITLEPGKVKGELWASYRMNPTALVKGATGTFGRGEAICAVPALTLRIRVK